MFSSLLHRPRPGSRRNHSGHDKSASPSPGPANRAYTLHRHATADFTEADDDGDESNEEGVNTYRNRQPSRQDEEVDEDEEEEGHHRDEDGRRGSLPVLPLFSASHLGKPPPISAVKKEQFANSDPRFPAHL